MISIIIPIYKVEQYLDECVTSVIKQTYKDIEIILVDDGSPDSCPQKCDEWAKKDGRIKVVHKKNGGLSSARNAGLKVAIGEYIGFVDSDDYVDETGNHVLYRVTPIFEGDDLVASGVLMEAYSVEDRGALSFCVYCYNVQPGIEIDYATGESWRSGEAPVTADEAGSEEAPPEEQDLPEAAADETDGGETVCITSSGTKFHRPDCRHAKDGAETLTRAEAEARGYRGRGTAVIGRNANGIDKMPEMKAEDMILISHCDMLEKRIAKYLEG